MHDGLRLTSKIRELLRCAYCLEPLVEEADGLRCDTCGSSYGISTGNAIDLRLTRPKNVSLSRVLGVDLDLTDIDFSPLKEQAGSPASRLYGGTRWHLSQELLSHLPEAPTTSSVVLDLGCGAGWHRDVCEKSGYDWVGMDYYEPTAPILGDAHALPFANDSFDFILSLAVLEHLRYPLVAMQECYRVLKRGRPFIGTVAFLEPFHGNSFYHHTHLGTLNSLASGGFKVRHVAPSTDWTVLNAQADMAFFPKMPSWLRSALILPLESAHKLWWSIGKRIGKVQDPALRILQSTGSFTFIAYK
jgi:SAM-dependent methyltransferase